MKKCPACGYQYKASNNIGKEMNTILKSKSRNTSRMLSKIASLIMKNIPSESRINYYQFLKGTKDIDDNVLCWAIEKFYQSRHFENDKGFAYLRTIAQNRGKNIPMIIKNERKRLGGVPPVYKGGEE